MNKKVLLFFLLSVLITGAAIPHQSALIIYYQNTDRLLAYLPFEDKQTFQIQYTHSIHLSNVVETYQATTDGKIQLYELEYEDFAIGMPANAEAGERFLEREGKYFIKNMNRTYESIDLRIGAVRANHSIIYNQINYPLKNFIEPGTWVRLKIKKLNLWQQLKGVNILES